MKIVYSSLKAHVFSILVTSLFVVVLSACGLGGQDLKIPEKRPEGRVSGEVLGGLYKGGTISAYTFDQNNQRAFLAKDEISESGNYSLSFATNSQALILEASGGTYTDPVSGQQVKPMPDAVFKAVLFFNSGQEHVVPIDLISHLETGLALHKKAKTGTSPNLSQVKAEIRALYVLPEGTQPLHLSYDEEQNHYQVQSDNRQGLLIGGLSLLANASQVGKDPSLKDQYSLSALLSVMYEDMTSDGQLNGKSVFAESGEEKTLAYGVVAVNENFYRLTLASAMQKMLGQTRFQEDVSRREHEDFILDVVKTKSPLMVGDGEKLLNENPPKIVLSNSLPKSVRSELQVHLRLNNYLLPRKIGIKIHTLNKNFGLDHVYDAAQDQYSILVDTSSVIDGIYTAEVSVIDAFDRVVTQTFELTIDNTPPVIDVNSADLTSKSQFLLNGNYKDTQVGVQNILINGGPAILDDNGQWSHEVLLRPGRNVFAIEARDQLGNKSSKSIEVYYDEAAPEISVTSADVSGNQQFLLTGTYDESDPKLEQIFVNGETVEMMADGVWSHTVNLVTGNNPFAIGVSDNAGNYIEFTKQIVLDVTAPEIVLTSSLLTNLPTYVAEGRYNENQSEVNRILVNGIEATLLANNKWSAVVNLNDRNNPIVVTIEDSAENKAQTSFTVVLDEMAPEVSVESYSLTNQAQHRLEGFFASGHTDIERITVEGQEAIINGSYWAIDITLSEGNNALNIGVEDFAGNTHSFVTYVYLDTIAPSFAMSLTTLTNTRVYELSGTYKEEGAGLQTLTINDVPVTITDNGNWTHTINLESGENTINIRGEDKAGNTSEDSSIIILDELAPDLNFVTDTEVRYTSGRDVNVFNAPMTTDGQQTLFVETNRLSLNGLEVNRENLQNSNIPFYELSLADQPLNGLETPIDKLSLEYRYLLNDSETLVWQSLGFDATSGTALLPLTSEYLSEAWYRALPSDTHTVEFRLKDQAGNVRQLNAFFKVRFYVPRLTFQIDDTANGNDLMQGSFDNRGDFINQDMIVATYSLHNDSGHEYQLELHDDWGHSLERTYNEARRVNFERKTTTVMWQRSSFATLGTIDAFKNVTCPSLANDWSPVSVIYNMQDNGNDTSSYVPIEPPSSIEDVPRNSDTLSPNTETEWADLIDFDEIFDFYPKKPSSTGIFFWYDYVVNPDATMGTENQPGRIPSWTYNSGVDGEPLVSCSPVTAIQEKRTYEYSQLPGYPKIEVSEQPISAPVESFYTHEFKVYAEDGTEIPLEDGEFTIPVNQTVKIVKIAKTDVVPVYNNIEVLADDDWRNTNLTSYTPYRYDSSYKWNISLSILYTTEFNPDKLQQESQSVRNFEDDFGFQQIEFVRSQ